jgi:hypothetical protein
MRGFEDCLSPVRLWICCVVLRRRGTSIHFELYGYTDGLNGQAAMPIRFVDLGRAVPVLWASCEERVCRFFLLMDGWMVLEKWTGRCPACSVPSVKLRPLLIMTLDLVCHRSV